MLYPFTVITSFCYFIATGLHSGKSSKAPGTVGTLAFTVLWITFFSFFTPTAAYTSLLSLTLIVTGTWCTARVLKHGTHLLPDNDRTDPKCIVIDEWCGQSIALVALSPSQPMLVFLAFLLFRFFDISKIGPVGLAERLPGAYGIMADDIVAGILALVSVQFINTIL